VVVVLSCRFLAGNLEPQFKDSLPALVRDLFTFSSKVIKSFIIVQQDIWMYKNRLKKSKIKNSGADGLRSLDV
jgi:hypothetical protein